MFNETNPDLMNSQVPSSDSTLLAAGFQVHVFPANGIRCSVPLVISVQAG